MQSRWQPFAGVASGVALATAISIGPAPVVVAGDYPSWDDVQAAIADEQAAETAIAEVRNVLVEIRAEVQRTQRELQASSAAWMELDARYRAKQSETSHLQAQVEDAAARVVEAEGRARVWAVQVVKITGYDPALRLFLESEDAGRVLSAIGVSARVSEHAKRLFEGAVQERNTAESLTDQAAAAAVELQRLEDESRDAMETAQAASEAAAGALIAQQEHQTRLERQLEVLIDRRIATEADYATGEQKRLEEQMSGVDWGSVYPSGWARPGGGWITSYYGNRAAGVGSSNHEAVDIANGCWTPVYAASVGTVVNASYHWSFGYNIIIDHGGGLTTRYAHMPADGFTVGYGQRVEAGQQIGYMGTTGQSTGCHLHFEVRAGGLSTDPLPFMAAFGILL